ncbi:MAG: YraN family protein [Bacteroidia bacterium]|jgi:putative endonuclease|nr:YraN family protein [Bacteroidia bacterium]
MHNHNSQFGKIGEEIATVYLKEKGYQIIQRNYKFSRVEVDIIARVENEIIFIEVKTRTSDQMAYPEQAVGKSKQKNIRLAAENFLEENQIELPVRFDIIAVVKNEHKFEIEHIEDAFYPFDVL